MAKKNFIIPPPLQKFEKVGFQIATTGIQAVKGQLFQVGEYVTDEAIGTSSLGTPVFDDITFPEGQFTNLFSDIIAYDEVKLQSVLITANRSKNIVKTPVSGRDGTIKEYIASGDFVISVSGVIVGDGNSFPTIEAENLRLLCDANASLPVISSFLNDTIGVFDLVIESDSYKQVRGSRNTLNISFSALSDVSRDIEELIID